MSKIEKIKRHLQRGWRLTAAQMRDKYDYPTPSAVIMDLRSKGLKILNHPEGGYYMKVKK